MGDVLSLIEKAEQVYEKEEAEAAAAKLLEGKFTRVEAIIRSMTRDERNDPTLIDGSRRLRIANGSGTQTADVSQLIKQFREMQKLMKRMPGISGTKGVRGRKGRKGRKGVGGRVTPPGGGPVTP